MRYFPLVFITILVGSSLAINTMIIDEFDGTGLIPLLLTVPSLPISAASSTGLILGTEREIVVSGTGLIGATVSANVNAGALVCVAALGVSASVEVAYDGNLDVSTTTTDVIPGLGPIDLTFNGGSMFVITVLGDGGECTLTIYSGTDISTATISLPDTATEIDVAIPFTNLIGTADVESVDAIDLRVDVDATLLGTSVSATVSAYAFVIFGYEVCGCAYEDVNGNGAQDPGEAVLAGITIEAETLVGVFIDATVTNPFGQYCLSGFPGAGTFAVTASDGTSGMRNNIFPVSGRIEITFANLLDVTACFGFSVTAGGSDPHMYSPFISTQGMELITALETEAITTKAEVVESSASLMLVEAPEAQLVARLGDVKAPREGGVYFTEVLVDVEGTGQLVLYTHLTDDGQDGTLAVRVDGSSHVCSRSSPEILTFSVGDVDVTVECGSQRAAYEANPLMMKAWSFQAKEAQGRVTIHSQSFRAEMFYIQQTYLPEIDMWADTDPFGFFNIQTQALNGAVYGGAFGNVLTEATRSVMATSGSPLSASAQFLASHLL